MANTSTRKYDINIVISMRDDQFAAVKGKVIRQLRATLGAANVTLPDPTQPVDLRVLSSNATKRVGGKVNQAQYDLLKSIAQANNLSMSKAAIRLLQLPE